MKKFEFVFVAKDNNFKIDRTVAEKINSEYSNLNFNFIANNSSSLAVVYNEFIQKHKNAKDIDYLVFMHADVCLDIIELVKHVESVEGKYDIIGLCGCSKISVGQSPLNWYTGSRPFPEYRWGCVTHGELNNSMTFFSHHSPEITDHEVSCIDGLCFILSKNAIENSNILFDTNFTFSHYDTDFSFQCVLKHKLKLGVIVRKDLQHYSVGKSILTPEFLESEKIFREKWKF